MEILGVVVTDIFLLLLFLVDKSALAFLKCFVLFELDCYSLVGVHE